MVLCHCPPEGWLLTPCTLGIHSARKCATLRRAVYVGVNFRGRSIPGVENKYSLVQLPEGSRLAMESGATGISLESRRWLAPMGRGYRQGRGRAIASGDPVGEEKSSSLVRCGLPGEYTFCRAARRYRDHCLRPGWLPVIKVSLASFEGAPEGWARVAALSTRCTWPWRYACNPPVRARGSPQPVVLPARPRSPHRAGDPLLGRRPPG